MFKRQITRKRVGAGSGNLTFNIRISASNKESNMRKYKMRTISRCNIFFKTRPFSCPPAQVTRSLLTYFSWGWVFFNSRTLTSFSLFKIHTHLNMHREKEEDRTFVIKNLRWEPRVMATVSNNQLTTLT